MKRAIKKVLGLAIALLLLGSSGARADFYGPFAPSAWTFSGDADGNSLTTSQMQITSSNIGGGIRTASYTINVPGNTNSISFSFHYITYDRDGSHFDLPYYSIGGTRTNMIADNCGGAYNSCVAQNGSQTGSITLTNVAGQSFAISQEALDGILGSAIITITNFEANLRYDDYLVNVNSPKLEVKDGIASCSPGTYRMSSGYVVQPNSVAYTLKINENPVSRVAFDPAGRLASHLFTAINHTITGAVSPDMAIWDISKLNDYKASCEVTVFNSGSMSNAQSNEFTDAVKTAEIAAKAQAWEDQRATATAANFTKEAREARKRAAARAVNG